MSLYQQRHTWLHALVERGQDVTSYITEFDKGDWEFFHLSTWIANQVLAQAKPADADDDTRWQVVLTPSADAPLTFGMLDFSHQRQMVKTQLGHLPFITGQALDPSDNWELAASEIASDYQVQTTPISWPIRYDMLSQAIRAQVRTLVDVKLAMRR